MERKNAVKFAMIQIAFMICYLAVRHQKKRRIGLGINCR